MTARLVALLNQRGLMADFERSFTTPAGERKPDLWLDLGKGGICVGSAKMGMQRELDALSSAQEYQQSIGSTYPLKETLAIVYPTTRKQPFVLRVLATPKHEAASWEFDELGGVAAKIDELIRSGWAIAQRGREAEETAMVRLLRHGVLELETCMKVVPLEGIEAVFGGRIFFETVLGLKDERKIPKDHLRTAAAYLLANQIVFYERLARETEKFQAIDETILDVPSRIQSDYFESVLDVDYQPIYGFDIVSKLEGEGALSALKKVILALRALAPHELERDVLGKVFHELIPLELRKTIAAYFTNASAANLLAALTVKASDSKVLDAACGSGSLLVAAYEQKAQLARTGERKLSERELHTRFVEKELTGIDIMPFSAHLAAVQLALQAPLYETENVRILIHDSTALRPGTRVSSVREVFHEAFTTRPLDYYDTNASAGRVALKEERSLPIELSKVDTVLMNPPFTRHERLPADYKDHLETRFKEYAEYLHGQVPLHGYFIFLADRFLETGGELGLVLPATTLNLNSVKGARRFLAKSYRVRTIITTFHRAAFSEDTQFREVLLIARKGHDSDGGKVGICFLKHLPQNRNDALDIAKRIQIQSRGSSPKYSDRNLDIWFTTEDRFDRQYQNWFKFVAVSDLDLLDFWEKLTEGNARLVPFKEFHKEEGTRFLSSLRIERKTLVSTPSTFIVHYAPESSLQEDRWRVDSLNRRSIVARSIDSDSQVIVPRSATLPGLRRGSSRRRMDVTKDHDFVVVRSFEGANAFLGASRAEYSVALRKWEQKARDRLSQLSLFRRFDLSAQGTSHLAFYSDVPYAASDIMLTVKDVPADTAKVLAAWLNSTFGILQVLLERIETRGSFIETPVFISERLLVPRLALLSERAANSILKTFESVRSVEFPSIVDQLDTHFRPRVDMDMAILAALGMPKRGLRERVRSLQRQVLDQILLLKDLMRGRV